MSREQWGHGYWKGVEDAQSGKVRKQYTFKDEVKYWIANMCCSNWGKSFDATLFPVDEWISYAEFCGFDKKYAKKVYDYILKNNYYDFEPGTYHWCYVSGSAKSAWYDDCFVIPIGNHTLSEWQQIVDELQEKMTNRKDDANVS